MPHSAAGRAVRRRRCRCPCRLCVSHNTGVLCSGCACLPSTLPSSVLDRNMPLDLSIMCARPPGLPSHVVQSKNVITKRRRNKRNKLHLKFTENSNCVMLRYTNTALALCFAAMTVQTMGDLQAAEFWCLGLGEPWPISGLHGDGVSGVKRKKTKRGKNSVHQCCRGSYIYYDTADLGLT